MPNIASVLKSEIARLARKELRDETQQLKKVSAQYRGQIAALRRRVEAMERQLGRLSKGQGRSRATSAPEAKATSEGASSLRFSAKGLAKHRQRLGLSAADMGALLGVTGQSVYKWEDAKARPRASQLPMIAAARALGKREAQARLAALAKKRA